MTDTFDKSKVVEQLFDPEISVILQELEHGEKELQLLSQTLGISEQQITERLSYLVQSGFVHLAENPPRYSVDSEKIAKIMESDDTYKGVVDGLTELDSYLN